jgi:hypothetical protein
MSCNIPVAGVSSSIHHIHHFEKLDTVMNTELLELGTVMNTELLELTTKGHYYLVSVALPSPTQFTEKR